MSIEDISARPVSDSQVEMTELVLSWMDVLQKCHSTMPTNKKSGNFSIWLLNIAEKTSE